MGSNTFGTHFCLTTFGESHGPAIGGVIDGCPSGLLLDQERVQFDLDARRPGARAGATKRKELDQVRFLSGIYEGKTTGAPIAFVIDNGDARPQDYKNAQKVHRPGHASFTHLHKYGLFDTRGGGRASGRETACRVVGGAIACQLLEKLGIELGASLIAVQEIEGAWNLAWSWGHLLQEPFFTLDYDFATKVKARLAQLAEEGDSCGGEVQFWAKNLPIGLGDPLFEKIPALLGQALLSIGATKALSLGEAQLAKSMSGSSFRDEMGEGFLSNRAGGVLGGITNGEPLFGRLLFKAPSSTSKSARTIDHEGRETTWKPKAPGRHDLCLAIRAVPVVRAMVALTLVDRLLAHCSSRLDQLQKIYAGAAR